MTWDVFAEAVDAADREISRALLVVRAPCAHPPECITIETASQWFEDAGAVLKFHTGRKFCAACKTEVELTPTGAVTK